MVDLDPLDPAMLDWPLFGWTDDVRPALAEARVAGRACVLATLYATAGGAPRPAGSQMLVDGAALHGFLSGGCIEGDIAGRSRDVARTGEPQRLIYGEGGPPDIRLVCGGRVDVLLERIAPDDAAVGYLLDSARARRPVLWASDGRRRVCEPDTGAAVPSAFPSEPLARVVQALGSAPELGCASAPGGLAVALRRAPAPRLIVVGRDPVALAIARLGGESGFETHLIRPKGPERSPPLGSVLYHRQDAGETLRALGLDGWSYVAVATHALEEDEDALVAALPSAAAYVGVLGARRRLPERLARLRSLGVAPAALDRLHAPIGLDIGGKAPFEIAVSVLAEVMAERNRRQPHGVVELDRSEVRAA